MSGLVAWFAPPGGMDPKGIRFPGPRHDVRVYRDPGLTLAVGARAPVAGGTGRSFGELLEAGRHVLACEGYVLDLDSRGGEAGGGLSRAEHLLERFLRDGRDALERLRGGFVIVVWDRDERVGTVAVCRYGQRTLYRREVAGGLALASDLAVLGRLGAPQGLAIDPEALPATLLQGGVPGRGTPLRGVAKVLPGTVLTVRGSGITEHLAPDLPRSAEAADPSRSTRAHLDALDGRMAEAAGRLASVADRQALMVGSGVDSAVVGAYARGRVEDLRAITQSMPGALDETDGARRTVGALAVRHEVVPYHPTDGALLLEEVARFVRLAGEPAYWNQLGPPLLRLLSQLPDPPGAFLTGAEGDHLFWFRTLRRPSLLRVARRGVLGHTLHYTARRLLNRVTRRAHLVARDYDLLDRELLRRHLAVELPSLRGEGTGFDPAYPHLAGEPNALRHFINNAWQNVRIISRLGQETGAEVLFPYLDQDVASYVHALPDELKIDKVLLRRLLARHLPRQAVPRGKMGYWAHTVRWHHERGALGPVLDVLSEPRTLQRGIVAPGPTRALVDAYARDRVDGRAHPVLWQLLLFEMFCREYVDTPPGGAA